MRILIIAKMYHEDQSARAIQMRRVVSALLKYTNHHIRLITQGEKKQNNENERFQIINITSKKTSFRLIYNVVDKLVCSPSCIRNNEFITTAIKISDELIAQNKIDILLTVSTPFDSHLVGLNVKKKNPNIRWLAFFSDLWPSAIIPKPYKNKKILSKRELSYMQEVAIKCEKILTPSEYTLDIIKKKFDVIAQLHQVQHCANILSTQVSDDYLHGYIIHSGFLNKERISEELVIAVKQLAKENSGFKGLIHIGKYDAKLKKLIQRHKCNSIYLLGSLPEEVTAKIQQLVEISIIIEAPMENISPFMPSKISDCLNSSKKIIFITPENSFLRKFSLENRGLFCCCYKVNSIKRCIGDALQSKEQISLNILQYFHPQTIATKYNELFQ